MWPKRLLRCPAVASAASEVSGVGSLTGWLSRLTAEVAHLPAHNEPTTSAQSSRLWDELGQAAVHAHTLHESDTVLALLNNLCAKGYYPTSASKDKNARYLWSILAERLLLFANAEASSVLAYPGLSKHRLLAQQRARLASATAASTAANGASDGWPHYSVLCDRDTLLMTGGIVPLSARAACDDGAAFATFVSRFCSFVEAGGVVTNEERAALSRSLVKVLAANSTTIRFGAVCDSVSRFVATLYEADTKHIAPSTSTEGPSTGLTLTFAEALCTEVRPGALGARLCLAAVAFLVEDATIASSAAAAATGVSVGMQHLLASEQFLKQEPAAQALQLRLVRNAARALSRDYDYADSNRSAGVSGPENDNSDPGLLRMAPLLRRLHSFLDAVFQFNATQGNVMQLSEAFSQEVQADLSLATLRALRVEATAPDVFLRQSMEVVDRCPPSMAVEAELIAGKAALFDCFDLNDESRAALYDDLVTSLRHLVDLRPRGDAIGRFASAAWDGNADDGEDGERFGSGDDTFSGSDAAFASVASGSTFSGSYGSSMDPASHRLVQTSHERVVRVLCDSLDEERINDAYNIVVTHKYHGLRVTKEVIAPLLEVMARRGDGRVFNLVDLCVLYSNATVDMAAIACLFRACAVAGDHYRARTLLQLLQDVVPGFLLKAPVEVRDSLRDLRVLPPEPLHLFVSEEDRLVCAALAGSHAPASAPELHQLPPSGHP